MTSLLQWAGLVEMRTAEERQMACDQLFRNEEEEYSLYEAVKFLMLSRAIELYDDKEKGKDVPLFCVLLFARDTSNDPGQLLTNHLNQVGHTGGLEQVRCALRSVLFQNVAAVTMECGLVAFIGEWFRSSSVGGCGPGCPRSPVCDVQGHHLLQS